MNVISVPAIAFVVYWVIAIIKYAVGENEKFKRFIPLIAAVLGVAGGIICFYALPDIIPADNVVVAIVIGGASGLTATATNQMIKQIAKKDEKTDKNGSANSDNIDSGDTDDKSETTAESSDSADGSQTDIQNINEADGETNDADNVTESDEKTDVSESDVSNIDDLTEEKSDTVEDSTPK